MSVTQSHCSSFSKMQTALVLQVTLLSTGHPRAPSCQTLTGPAISPCSSWGKCWVDSNVQKGKSCGRQGQLTAAASSILAKLICLLVDVYLPSSAYIMDEMCICGPNQRCYSWDIVCSEFPTCEHNPFQVGTKRKDFIIYNIFPCSYKHLPSIGECLQFDKYEEEQTLS